MFEARYTIVAGTVSQAEQTVLQMKELSESVKEQAQRAHEASLQLRDINRVCQQPDLADILGLESMAFPYCDFSQERAKARRVDDITQFARKVEQVQRLFERLRWLAVELKLMAVSDRICATTVAGGEERLKKLYFRLRRAWEDALSALRSVEESVASARHTRALCQLNGIVTGGAATTLQFLRDATAS